jgi:hypothetical protein
MTLPFVRSEEDEFELADPEGYRLLEAMSKELNSTVPLDSFMADFFQGLLDDLNTALQSAGQARHSQDDAALRDYTPPPPGEFRPGTLALLMASSLERMAKRSAQELREIAGQGPLSQFAIEGQPSQSVFKAIDPQTATEILVALNSMDLSAEPASVQSAAKTLKTALEAAVSQGEYAGPKPYAKGVAPSPRLHADPGSEEEQNAALVQGVADKYRRAHKDIVNLT